VSTSTYVALRLHSLFEGAGLCSFDLTPVGVGLNCMDNREGGRIPDPDAVLAE